MRTKHLLTAMVLPALFAACSSEEFEGVNNSANELKGRVELGKVTLTVGDEADTRFAAGTGDDYNGFVAADGDAIGACLVDVTGGTENTLVGDQTSKQAHMGLYNLVNDIQTNYAFKQAGASWSCEGNLVEGNYLFYLPYNKDHKTRTAMTAKLPTVQTLTVKDGAVVKESAIDYVFAQGGIMGVQHLFMDRSDNAAVLSSLRPVYAYPLITLVNQYTEDTDGNPATPEVPVDVVVKQIVIKKNSGTFTTEAPIQVSANPGTKTLLEGTTRTGAAYALAEKISYTKNGATTTLNAGEFVKPANAKYEAKTSSLLGAATANGTSAAIVLKPSANVTVAKDGGSVEFYAVIPGEAYGTGDLTIEVTTNKGTFSKTITNPAIAAGRRYPLYEYDANGKLIEPTLDPDGSLVEHGKGAEYSIAMVTPGSASVIVATTDDLVAQLRNAVNDATLNVTPLSKDVVFSADAAAAFKANTTANFALTINGNITLATGLADGTVPTKSIEVKGDAYATGTVTIDDRWALRSKLIVAAGANVTVEDRQALSAGIYNAGTLTIAEGCQIVSVMTNSGTINLNDVAVVNANAGTINVDANGVAGAPETLDWTTFSFKNTNGTVNVKSYTILSATGGAIENSKTLNVEANAEVKELKNSKDVNNYGKVTGDNTGTIQLMSANAKLGAITDNAPAGTGRINNSIDITATIDAATMACQIVYYEFANQTINGALYPQTGKYNTIVLNNTTWNPTATQELGGNLEMKNSTISVYTPDVKIKIPKLKIMNGQSTFKGNAEAKILVKDTVAKESNDAHLTVSNVTAKYSTGPSYTNAGTTIDSF